MRCNGNFGYFLLIFFIFLFSSCEPHFSGVCFLGGGRNSCRFLDRNNLRAISSSTDSFCEDFTAKSSVSLSRSSHYQPNMAVQENGNIATTSGGSLTNGYGAGIHHQNGIRSSSSTTTAAGSPDFLVVLYGCSGYGELAVKMNSGISLMSHGGGTVVNGGGAAGVVDNQALQLWDEEAETVLLAWAVVDAKLNKVL